MVEAAEKFECQELADELSEMGVLGCLLDAPSAAAHVPDTEWSVWHFTIRGDSLVGELRLSDGTKVRDVRTGRSR
jgi:hypothetical protein